MEFKIPSSVDDSSLLACKLYVNCNHIDSILNNKISGWFKMCPQQSGQRKINEVDINNVNKFKRGHSFLITSSSFENSWSKVKPVRSKVKGGREIMKPDGNNCNFYSQSVQDLELGLNTQDKSNIIQLIPEPFLDPHISQT